MATTLTLVDFQRFAEEFAANNLDAYTAELSQRGSPGRKEINDPLWGTISLSGSEVAIIDSPLLQRLRLIRQLGVVHWVYPGAIHTRFEHTLGVMRQVQQLTTAINAQGEQDGLRDLIPQNKISLLRLAALLHDVGHAAFSHVSEHAINNLDVLSSVPAEFSRMHHSEERALSEIFAYFVVQSPAMTQLLEVIISHDGDYIRLNSSREANVKEITTKASRCIIGLCIDDRLPLLHEIISGPFDADKLDYFVRDARAAGTPSLLDISRLIQKIALREFDASELPGKVGRDVRALKRHVLFGMKWSGISVLDELHLSRILLYSKIYKHPKVVAIEQMVHAALSLLAIVVDAGALLRLVYNHNDDEILAMSSTALAAAVGVQYGEAAEIVRETIDKAAKIFGGIRLRKLMVRCFQLQRTYPGGVQDQSQKNGLIEFREVLEQPQDAAEFRNRLIAEVTRIIELLKLPPRSHIDLYGSIMVHPVDKTRGGTQIGRAFLFTKTGSPIEFKDYLVNRTAWADSYLSDQPAGYVFSDPEISDITFIAVESLIRKEHGIILPVSALEMSKRDVDKIHDIKKTLMEAGYYSASPYDIRPESARLGHADVFRSITNFMPKFQRYHAPAEAPEDNKASDDGMATARRWLKQFEIDSDIDCATRVIDNIKMIDRRDTVDAIRSFIALNKGFSGALLIPFGSARDSGAIHGYFAADLLGDVISECLTLDEACHKHRGRPIIFLDDFVGSGGQSKDVLAAGFGRDDLRSGLGEARDLFSADIQGFLGSAQLAFVFTAAWDSGISEVQTTANRLGLNAVVYHHIGEDKLPFLDKALEGISSDEVRGFIERSKAISIELLRSQTKPKSGEDTAAYERRLASRALGYGNRGMLLASPFNVPTQTFTPIWARGSVAGQEWCPLLPRRKKA